jgi:hypothetical protein
VIPEVEHALGFTRYSGAQGAEHAHEAGFDAFMTGACFAKLLPLIATSQAMQAASTVSTPPVCPLVVQVFAVYVRLTRGLDVEDMECGRQDACTLATATPLPPAHTFRSGGWCTRKSESTIAACACSAAVVLAP